jgi:MFS family permease
VDHENSRSGSIYRKNFWLVAGNGVLSTGAFSLFDPTLVLTAFIVQVGGSEQLIGFAGAVMPLAFSWPQLFVANLIQPKPRKMFVYRWGMVARLSAFVLLAVMMWTMRTDLPTWFPYALLGLLFIHWSFTGISNVAWIDIIAKVITPRDRPLVFAWRQSGGQAMALLAGFVISWALSTRSGLVFPNNYLFLLVLMTIILTVGLAMFAVIDEPVDPASVGERRPWLEYFRSGPRIVREDADYRRLLISFFAFAVALAGTPFLVPFLIRRIGMSDAVVGPLMIITSVVTVFGTMYYGWLGNRSGNRAVIVLASRLVLFSPGFALAAALLPEIRVWSWDLRFILIAFALVLSRVAGFAMGVGRQNYLLDIAPADRRPTYTSFWQAFALVTTVLPIFTGMLVQSIGYVAVFGVCGLFGLLSLATAHRLREPRHEWDRLGNEPRAGSYTSTPDKREDVGEATR